MLTLVPLKVISDVVTLTFSGCCRMKFGELNDDNYVMFAIKNYENPHSVTREDFDEDMKRFKYLRDYSRGTYAVDH